MTLAPTSLATHDPTNPLHAPRSLPDLVASTNDAPTVDETQAPRLCGFVLNRGADSLAATPFFVELRIDDVGVNATLVSERLGANQGVTVCWTLGEPLKRGYYRFTVVADSEEDLPETNETNNAARERWMAVSAAPQSDLRVKSFTVYPRVARPGQYQVFTFDVVNGGRAASGEAAMELRDDHGVLGEGKLRALQPGETDTMTVLTNPDARPMGAFTAIATLDILDAVDELNELNNVAYFDYEIPPRPAPDLVVSDASVNGTLVARRGLRLDVTVTNVGPRVAPIPVVRLMEGNVTLANATRNSLAPGANATFQFHFVLPAGERVLRVVADPDSAIVEANESNNVLLVPVTIAESANGTGPGAGEAAPNLFVKSLTAMPDDPSPGEPVLLTALVGNSGDATANATSLAFYADGKLLGRKPLPPLGPDRYATVSFSWGTSTEGDHDLRASADPDDALREGDEHDNDVLAYVAILSAKARQPPATNVTMPEPPEGAEGAQPPAQEGGDGGPAQGGEDDGAPPPPPRELALGELSIRTAPVPGGVKGVFVVAIRNPSLDPISRITVAFSVDGQVVKEVLVSGLAAAASAAASSGEIDVPEGKHTVKAEVRIVGSEAVQSAEGTYEAQAGAKGIPGAGALLVAAAGVGAAFARRRRR